MSTGASRGERNRKGEKIRTWLSEPLPAEVKKAVERSARAQDVQRIAVMPDVHLATGVCVGSVVATSHLIYPQAVGGDIGCGMAAMSFDAEADLLYRDDTALAVLGALREAVPTMRHPNREVAPPLPAELTDQAVSGLALSDRALTSASNREGRVEFGTLGRGNHFLEFQADGDGRLWLMIHSGSRHMGQAITELHSRHGTSTAGGLWFLDADTAGGQAYLRDMAWARAYAGANRRQMATAAAAVIDRLLSVQADRDSLFACDHNHVQSEEHFAQRLWVHRKGAAPADDGQLGIIPGSMGTHSFHVLGRGCEDALCSSSHGAGRRLSRDQARRQVTARELVEQMTDVRFDKRLAVHLREEAPSAYKDVDAVMRAQRDLTRIVRRLQPVLVYKGV
jgi:tRNA-splicing ligase RtcB (3'-phosphate/5'-hydroxy nucleic acid ligase)